MAEVHIIGQILGASEFPENSLYCRWNISCGSGWKLLQGIKEGQTHVDTPTFEEFAAWSHPIDVHYATKGLQGWPKVNFQVFHLDSFGRSEIYGYGSCYVPSTPGYHEIECVTWRPIGTMKEQITSYFVGGGLQLKNPELAISNSESYRLKTASMGKIHLRLNVLLRNFDKYGVEF